MDCICCKVNSIAIHQTSSPVPNICWKVFIIAIHQTSSPVRNTPTALTLVCFQLFNTVAYLGICWNIRNHSSVLPTSGLLLLLQNPWDKEFIPKDFPTTHKIPLTMPKRWDLHASSPLMLRPPQSTAVMEVPDLEITKYPSWLEAFAARSTHTSSMSATSMVRVYNFLQKITRFLRASAAKDNIQNDITLVDDLIQRANSMALEAHLMAHDAGVTSTELFTHLHMIRRHTVLESPTVDLPQQDKDRLLVMSVGGNDLFGPDARKVHEWKRDTEEEKVKLISRVFDERDQRDKAKKPSSSDSRPPRSLSHRYPLESISRPRPKDSYNQQPGQSFRRPPKQSPYKSRTGAQSKSQTFNRDKKTSSSNRSDNRDQGQRPRDREPKGSQSAHPFHKKGRGGGSGQGRK